MSSDLEIAFDTCRTDARQSGALLAALLPTIQAAAAKFAKLRRLQHADRCDLEGDAVLRIASKYLPKLARYRSADSFIRCIATALPVIFRDYMGDNRVFGESGRTTRRKAKGRGGDHPDTEATIRRANRDAAHRRTIRPIEEQTSRDDDAIGFTEVRADLHAACHTRLEHDVVTLRLEGWSDYDIARKSGEGRETIRDVRKRVCTRAKIVERHALALGA